MSRRRTRKSISRSCDQLWAQLVKANAGGCCERCGATPEAQRGFQAHHVYKRNNYRLRWEPRNGCALCGACHYWVENNPLPFADWFREKRPEDATWLIAENMHGLVKRNLQDYLELEARLTELLKGQEDADG